jgi:transcription termination factor Rho
MNIVDLEAMTLNDLRELARDAEIMGFSRLKKQDLILALLRHHAEQQGHELRGGVLDVIDDGIGFLRADHYLPGPNDIYVSQTQIRRFNLRTGDMVIGQVRPPKDNEKYYGLLRVEAVNGLDPEQSKVRPYFEQLTPIFPERRFNLETSDRVVSTRLINLIAPIGRGQRGLIVSPPKAGKTTILKDIANAISSNYPEVHLMVLLIGERPEEVTDMDRSVEAEVIASTFDETWQNQVRVSEMALARSKRLVESGKDVVILMDSITCLVDTGSRMDDVIYEEFKGTGNMELHLSRKLQERRVFPAFDIERSSTRREELLLGPDVVQRVWLMRRMFSQMTASPPQGAGMDLSAAIEAVVNQIRRTESNEQFLELLTTDAID